jgi:hypothetical protein
MSEHIPAERVDDKPLERVEETRHCRKCGTRLCSYNKDKLGRCSICQSKEAQAAVENPEDRRRPTSWRRSFKLQRASGSTAPPYTTPLTSADLQALVAYECGLSLEQVRLGKGGLYHWQVARAIFVYLTYEDLCEQQIWKTAKTLEIDKQRVKAARRRIEAGPLPSEVAGAMARIRSHYKPAGQAAA